MLRGVVTTGIVVDGAPGIGRPTLSSWDHAESIGQPRASQVISTGLEAATSDRDGA